MNLKQLKSLKLGDTVVEIDYKFGFRIPSGKSDSEQDDWLDRNIKSGRIPDIYKLADKGKSIVFRQVDYLPKDKKYYEGTVYNLF